MFMRLWQNRLTSITAFRLTRRKRRMFHDRRGLRLQVDRSRSKGDVIQFSRFPLCSIKLKADEILGEIKEMRGWSSSDAIPSARLDDCRDAGPESSSFRPSAPRPIRRSRQK